MSKKTAMKPLAVALGAAFVTSLAGTSVANAADNPFGMTELSSGYMVAAEGKCGGEKKEAEGKCGEGKCGGEKKEAEGKCGEGKCGGEKKEAEGKCGGEKKEAEGKCGGAK
ncbi:HvfA family oxazolone/thioamide-modified RiPP metallophore [Thiogranum longum]